MRRLLLCLLLIACQHTPTREDVVRQLVSQRLVPDQQALSARSRELTFALSKPNVELDAARKAWRQALLAWERVYVFRLGPVVDNSGLLRARFWPLRTQAFAQRVKEPLAAADVEQLGVSMRGMYALEWLLFASDSLRQDGSDGALARSAAKALAQNVQHYADDALAKLGDGAALSEQLSEHGQETISKIVNQLVATVETLATDRLATVLEMHAFKNLRASEVQGAPSGSSRELVLAQLHASERMYRGLSALVLPVAPQIDERVRARFAKALRLVSEVDGPLEQVVIRDRKKLEEAFRALKELEVALKVDLASALGVTLTFTAGDGD
ncbi:MAG: imelysin family protein [Polyangiales bacterium]